MHKFLERVERLIARLSGVSTVSETGKEKLLYAQNHAVKSVSADIEVFAFNTAIARIMEFVNALAKYLDGEPDRDLCRDAARVLVKLLAPFTPHFSEELWEQLGEAYSVFNQPYPVCDESALTLDTVEMPLQINGKVRARFHVANGATAADIEKQIMDTPALTAHFEGKAVKKVIIVPGRIANIVVG
jgi:leucyl-tRNA synthetase